MSFDVKWIAAIGVVALTVSIAPATRALDNSWTNSADGKWEDAPNWSLGVAPTNAHSVFITNTLSKTVQIDATTSGSFSDTMAVTDVILAGVSSATNVLALSNTGTNSPLLIYNNLSIASGGSLLMTNSGLVVNGLTGGLFSLDGPAALQNSILSVSTNSAIKIGDAFTGSLVIAGGTNGLSGDVFVGFSTNSSGSIDLADGQTLWTNGFTVVGFFGLGHVVLSNGTLTVAHIPSATNDINVANGVFLGLASGSVGDLTIAGGKCNATELLALGDESGSTGSVLVSGGQLLTGTNDYLLTIGNNGVGQLVLSNGQLNASYVIVANGQGSRGTLTIAGGTGTCSRALSVGVAQGATGTVTIAGGRLDVTNHQVIIGDFGVGEIAVSNGGFRPQTVVVGRSKGSLGTLTISGGTTSVASNLVAGMYSNATGTIQVTGGELDIANQSATARLVVGQLGMGVFSQDGGMLNVDQLLVTNGINSIFNFSSGTFNTKSTTVSNSQPFVVGDGSGNAIYHLLGGVHTFNDGLRIANAATLSGCGTITGRVLVDVGGRVITDCGGALTFTSVITNNGVMKAVAGSTLESYGTVVNNGLLNILSGKANFLSGFINNGVVLDADSIPQITSIQTVGPDVEIGFTTSTGATYIVEYRTDLSSGGWTLLPSVVGNGGNISVIDTGAALLPQKFYRVRLVVPE